jgi:hypothetical protein
MMGNVTVTGRPSRQLLLGALLIAAAGGLFAGCASLPLGPTYTDTELKAICERRGGWWRGDLIDGYCEYELALQAP